MNAADILGQLIGAGSKGSGSLNTGSGAKVLEDLLGVGRGGGQQAPAGGQQPQARTGGGGLGDLLGKALQELGRANTGGQPQQAPSAAGNNPFEQTPPAPQISQDSQAEIYIRAMIQAGLADGRLDEQEQQNILQRLGNVGTEEQNFIRAEMAKGADVNAFIQTVPRGIEEEVYTISLLAIQLDNKTEAMYLDSVAKGLRVTKEQSNAIHDKVGVQRLYS